MTHTFFYDTWAFAALANRRDAGHVVAVELDRKLEELGYVAVTSDYVLDETLTFLNVAAGARVAVEFLDLFVEQVTGREIQLVEVTRSRRDRAFEIFRRLAPSERRLSFTDATSFALMHELSVRHAFTADRHFHRAGQGIRPLVETKAGRLRATDIE